MASHMRTILFGASSAAALMVGVPVLAQQAAQQGTAASTGKLEEIVVTARKTEEKLQVSPVSVTAITAAKLSAQNINTVDALNGFVPNLNITKGSGYASAANITIRGVNQADNVLTNDAPIAVYVDGVYMARQIGDIFDLVDRHLSFAMQTMAFCAVLQINILTRYGVGLAVQETEGFSG